MTAFKRSQAKYLKHSCETTNWPESEAGLRQHGSLTVWIAEDELKGWGPPRTGQDRPAIGVEASALKSYGESMAHWQFPPSGSVQTPSMQSAGYLQGC
jgi:hypothetical protein